MEFCGTNTITLSIDTVKEIVRQKLQPLIGNARIVSCEMEYYCTKMKITFTNDPEQPVVPIKDAA